MKGPRLKKGLWKETLVVVAKEFGRTEKINGTHGTDQGTAAVAMLLGGAVNGGRVVADWPGLSDAEHYEGRDLRPTAKLDSVIMSAIAPHFGLVQRSAQATIFRDSRTDNRSEGLVRAQ